MPYRAMQLKSVEVVNMGVDNVNEQLYIASVMCDADTDTNERDTLLFLFRDLLNACSNAAQRPPKREVLAYLRRIMVIEIDLLDDLAQMTDDME